MPDLYACGFTRVAYSYVLRHVDHLTFFIENRDLYQSGFRRHHSRSTTLLRLCDTRLSSVKKTQITDAVFLDIKSPLT